jgi:hypothetical protein
MTDREIQQKLLAYYKENLPLIPKNKRMASVVMFLRKRHMDLGVCHCAKYVFNVKIYGAAWVDRFTDWAYTFSCEPIFWGAPPVALEDIDMIIKSVEHRIYLLEKLLNQ